MITKKVLQFRKLQTKLKKRGLRHCSICKKIKPLSQFFRKKTNFDGIIYYCKYCSNKKRKKWIKKNKKYVKKWYINYRIKNRKRLRKYFRKYFSKDKIKWSKYAKEKLLKLKSIVFKKYGNKCACCGETNSVFFTIDHIKKIKKENRPPNSPSLYYYIIRNNFPKNLQILCWNCNLAKEIYGQCPHRQNK